MNICIIRHGETDWNAEGRFQGREDIPLNENGVRQAQLCGLALKGRRWSVVFTSPLMRAKRTAEIIAEINVISQIHEDCGLMERDYGKASGLTPGERGKLFPDGNYDGIEEWDAFERRVHNAVLRCAHAAHGGDIIIVSHGNVIDSILSKLLNYSVVTGKTHLKNACVNLLEYENNTFKILFYNKSADEVQL